MQGILMELSVSIQEHLKKNYNWLYWIDVLKRNGNKTIPNQLDSLYHLKI